MEGAGVADWGVFLAGIGVRGVAILAVTGLAALALRRASAAGRHLVWLSGMGGLLLLPLAATLAPRWGAPVEVPAWMIPAAAPVPAAPLAPVPLEEPWRGGRAAAVRDGGVRVDVGASGERPTASVAVDARASGEGERPAASATVEDRASAAGVGSRAPSALGTVRRSVSDGPGEEGSEAGPSGGAFGGVGARTGPPIAVLLLGAWLAGAVLLLSSLGASLLAVRRLAGRCRPFPSGRATRAAGRIAARMGVRRPVGVLEGEPGVMPMSWGLLTPTILLPEGAERWHAARLDAVLLHEMAHVRRRDCLTQVLAEVARALHWPNPLAWIAVERLRGEREHACDDLVLERGSRPSEYARELLSLARGFHPEPGSRLAAVAMARPAHLRERLEAVLEEGRPRSLSRGRAAATLAAAGVLTLAVAGVAPAAEPPGRLADGLPPFPPPPERVAAWPGAASGPGSSASSEREEAVPPGVIAAAARPQSATCGAARDGWRRWGTRSSDGRRQITWERPGCEVEVRVEGEIAFTPDFREVARLGPDALLRIEEDDEGTERLLEIRAGAGGAPVYDYRVEGREQAFDPAARAWYRGLLLHVFRRSGYMAEERVAAMLREGGVPAVLREMSELEADHVFATYAAELLDRATLSEVQVVDLVGRSRTRVESDHYMGEILEAVAARHLGSDRVLAAFVEASATLESDHYRSEVLTRALERGDLPAASVEAILASALSIESDHYLSELLRDLGERYALDPRLRATYLRAVESIESDHYRAEVLASLLGRRDLEAGELAAVVRATRAIESDHYLTGVLADVASYALESEGLRSAYLDATASIESDHYKAEALGYLVEREALSRDLLGGILEAAGTIGSGHYRSELLLEIVRRHRLEGPAREAFLDAMDGIGSSHYRAQVADALLRRERGG